MTYSFDPLTGDPIPKTFPTSAEEKREVKQLSDDELRLMARDKLSALLQSLDANSSPSLVLAVAREVMDRIEGKPMQRIKQDTTVSFDLKANSVLLNRFRERLGVKEQIVIEGTTSSSDDTVP